MSIKSQIEKKFIDDIAHEINDFGYSRSSNYFIHKNRSEDIPVIIRFEFFGLSQIEAVCYYGAHINGIEILLRKMNSFPGNKLQIKKKDQTIFQRIDKSYQIFSGKKIPSSMIIKGEEDCKFDQYIEVFEFLRPIFSNVRSLSEYIAQDNDLPLGHHAFRIPFLLMATNRKRECESYMSKVLKTGFIPRYAQFIDEFWSRSEVIAKIVS